MLRIVSIFMLLSLISLYSCKKPVTPTPAKFAGCRISQITEIPADTSTYVNSRTVYHYYYNNDGTVQHMYVFVANAPSSSYYKYFTYKNSSVLIRMSYAQQNYVQAADSLSLDAQGRVIYIYHGHMDYSSYSNPEWDGYRYDSTGAMLTHTSNNYGNFYTNNVFWQNGDPVIDSRVLQGSGTTDLYANTYNDTLYNTGNLTVNFKYFERYGMGVYSSKHLLTYVYDQNTNGDDTTKTYKYVLDAGGRITNIAETINGGDVNTTKVVYECQ